ncbi:hypothetical protein ACVIGB_008451 [Bradyrhizobium sp. USDA 4341]
MGVTQEFLGLAAWPWRSKQWMPLIVDAMQSLRQCTNPSSAYRHHLRSGNVRAMASSGQIQSGALIDTGPATIAAQDGQEQAVVYVRMSSSEAQADSLSRMAAWNPWHHGRASTSPSGLRRWIGANRCGAVERTLLMSLWRSATAEIAANSGVPPWLKRRHSRRAWEDSWRRDAAWREPAAQAPGSSSGIAAAAIDDEDDDERRRRLMQPPVR